MTRRRAFTLVELLVVIGIIALLISILLPVLNKARQQANEVKCQSNMRQLYTAMVMYASESRDQIPYCNLQGNVNSTNVYGFGWLFASGQFRTGWKAPNTNLNGGWPTTPALSPANGAMTGILYPYLNKNLVPFHCPLDIESAFWQGTESMTSYLMNGSQCGFGRLGSESPPRSPGLKLNQVAHSAECVIFWEALEQPFQGQNNTGAHWNDGSSWAWEENIADRHFKGANVIYLDGHSEWWDQRTWTFYATGPGSVKKGPLYWWPFTATGQ